MRTIRCLCVAVTLLLVARSGYALIIAVQTVSANAGDSADVCVFMTGSEGQVSGVQMDLSWDASALSVELQGGDEAACVNNTDRQTFRTKVSAGGSSMRVLMLSISDTTPMAASVNQLFCCQFRASSNSNTRSVTIALNGVIASDPTGKRIPLTSQPGQVNIAATGGSMGGNLGGNKQGGGVVVPPVITGGAPAPAAGGAQPAAPGAPAAAAPAAAAPAAKGAAQPAVPGVPAAQQLPQDMIEHGAGAVMPTIAAAVATPQAATSGTPQAKGTGTPKSSPAAGTPTAKAGTPKPEGTPSPEAKKTGPAGTPTAAKKE